MSKRTRSTVGSLLPLFGLVGLPWLLFAGCQDPARSDRAPALNGVNTIGAGGANSSPAGTTSGIGFGSGSGSGAMAPEETVIPDPNAPCDDGIEIDEKDPVQAAAALGVCTVIDEEDDQSWGLVSARWTMVDGTTPIDVSPFHLGHGIVDDFGSKLTPLEGKRMLLLSSGTARRPNDPGYKDPKGFDKQYNSNPPLGFPKESPACPGVVTGATYDDIALELELKAPENANALAFDFNFFTWEWPEYVCSEYNDFFVALLEPFPAKQSDGNISFDSKGNPVSVNNGLVRVCSCSNGPPCDAPIVNPQKTYDCGLGSSQLKGTGFEGHAATGWLRTSSPIGANAVITLRLGIYDSGDGVLDSTSVIDNLRWLGDPVETPGTQPK